MLRLFEGHQFVFSIKSKPDYFLPEMALSPWQATAHNQGLPREYLSAVEVL
jgi:hypothetical protein